MPERPSDEMPAVGRVNAEDPPPPVTCFYQGLRYSPGARIVAQTGEVLECQFTGAWGTTDEHKGG